MLAPYFKALRSQMATILWPAEKGAPQDAALACHRILTQLLLQESLAPKLEAQALIQYAALLDDMEGALQHDTAGEPSDLCAQLHRDLRLTPDYATARNTLQQLVVVLQQQDTPRSRALMKCLVMIELELERSLHAAATAAEPEAKIGSAAAAALSSDELIRLQAFLRDEMSEPALKLGDPRLIPGGFSKKTIFIEANNTRELPNTLVLRMDKADSPMTSSVADEFGILQTSFKAGVPVPQPFALSTDPSIIGAPFLVVAKVEGGNIGDALNVTQPNEGFGISLAHTLARLHAIDPECFGNSVPGANSSARERMLDDIGIFETKWRACRHASPALELAYAWLKQHADLADGRRSLIHRDVGCHNILANDNRVTALLDWESAVIGNPAQDLGYAYHTVVQLMPWNDFVAEYSAEGGEVPSPAQVQYYRLWRAVWLATMLAQVHAAIQSGTTDDFGLAYNSVYQFRRLNLTLCEVLDEVLS